ncbi:SCO2322 family protein [Streptomyces sp. NPDC050560]|uniref:SCO2322 family protein n=1 Tax=Streptomyces sp. NPDC050560 TaxID=3365630 RepID=UPI00379F6283
MRSRALARVPLVLLGVVGLLLAGVLGAGTAQAAGYRYWSFWQLDGGDWTYASRGPSVERPDDGAVLGFRFSVSEDSGDAATPRGGHGFAAICAHTPARDGDKRLALVLDFGVAADAPAGETPPKARTACARVDGDGSAADALAAVAKPLRYDSVALLCAIAGYPRTGCGEQVSGARPTAASSASADRHGGDGHTPSAGIAAGVAVVAVLGAAALWQARRRRG